MYIKTKEEIITKGNGKVVDKVDLIISKNNRKRKLVQKDMKIAKTFMWAIYHMK